MMRESLIFCVLTSSMVPMIWGQIKNSSGRCRTPETCCTGRDSSCFVSNISDDPYEANNGLMSFDSSINEPCYCDEGCLETGDCCADYEEICTFEGKLETFSIFSMLMNDNLKSKFYQ